MNVTQQPIQFLKGVGAARAEKFEKLGVTTVGELLALYPRRYIDYSQPLPAASAPYDEPCVIRAQVLEKAPPIRTRNGSMTRVKVQDDSALITLTFFNNPYAANALNIGDEYLFYGKLSGPFTHRDMVAPAFLPAATSLPITPVYPLTQGLSTKTVWQCVQNAITMLEKENGTLPEPLPPEILAKHGFMGKHEAVRTVHMPQSMADVASARQRLIYEELFTLQLGLLQLKGRKRTENGAEIKRPDMQRFFASLPFEPTGAQKRAIDEILTDMHGPQPMSRLLQGDVGSGKTLVAAAAMFAAAKNGYQSALMAPTELLCVQHANTLQKLLAPLGIEVALLTGSVKGAARKTVLAAIKNGDAQVVVGTHALISARVEYNNLALSVTDEQHRFGVRQRSELSHKGAAPHMLVMSATPIPRTLGLIIFGDLDISLLDEMPPGRTPVKTRLVDSEKRERMFGFIRERARAGEQTYIVCPAIEEGPSQMTAVTPYYEQVAKPLLGSCTSALLHGRMKPAQKNEIMAQFAAGEISVLCSTTVIEVGVDVPNASIMVIENADRFGLSALHQLRGRVGRGKAESYCFLITDSESENARARLKLLCSTADGFEVAKYDLETRGPGDFFGSRQHGLPALNLADLASDMQSVQAAQEDANALLREHPDLAGDAFAPLREAVQTLFADADGSFN